MTARPRDQRGFSLLEVLVAFAILALTLGVLSQVFSSALRNTLVSGRYSDAMIVAESRLAVAAQELEDTDSAGEDGDFAWTLAIDDYEVNTDFSSPNSRLVEIRVQVRWEDFSRERQLELTTLRLAGAK